MGVSESYRGDARSPSSSATRSTTSSRPRHFREAKAAVSANNRAATSVGLDTLTAAEWEAHFGRFAPLPGNLSKPLALRYHGHQFRVYNPALGDGRGFLFAQLRDAPAG